jgi:putative transcriptional regulator
MTKAFDSIMRGLTEMETYLQGNTTGAIVHHINVPTPDVKAIRASTGLSQADFARSIGVKKATLLNGPARVLLALIAKEPGIVGRVLG